MVLLKFKSKEYLQGTLSQMIQRGQKGPGSHLDPEGQGYPAGSSDPAIKKSGCKGASVNGKKGNLPPPPVASRLQGE